MTWRPPGAAALLVALALWAGFALDRREGARQEHRRVAAAAALPRLTTLSGQLIAPTQGKARAALAQRIGDAGAAAGVRLSLSPLPGDEAIQGVVTLRTVARGDEAGLLRFSAAVEQGTTLIRWSRWSILPDGDGGLRLTADAAAPWRAR